MAGITSLASRYIGKVTNTKLMKGLYKKFEEDPVGTLAKVTITSIALKDGIGCGFYVLQSLNNKGIPEDRRPFVSALDLTNGLLMILAQVGMFFGMRKFNEPIFNAMFRKTFGKGKPFEKVFIEQTRVDQKAAGLKPSKKHIISDAFNKIKNDKLNVFKTITELVAATIIGKRIIVPLIATPLASKVEKYMIKKGIGKDKVKEDGTDKSDIPMTGKLDVVAKDDNSTVKNTTSSSTNLLDKYRN